MTVRCRIPGVATVMFFAACGGDDETGPATTAVTTTIDVAVTSPLLAADTVIATALVKDQFGHVLAGKTVSWGSISSTVASVSQAGVVTGSQVGTTTITASVDGKTGSAPVTVSSDDRFGYVWADDQSSASYIVSNGYVYTTAGGFVTITRSAAGMYAVTFAGLAATGAQRTGVQVSPYSTGSAHCKAAGWRSSGADLVVDVRCFSSTGVATDARYTVLATGATALSGRFGFAYADNASAGAAYTPSQVRSTRGHGIRVTRASVGTYTVAFDGLVRGATDGPEQIMVTSVGDGAERCTVGGWNFSTFSITISCYNATGALVDSKFSVLLVEKGRPTRKLAFTWANDPISALYTPSTGFTLNDGGGLTQIIRTSVGNYQVMFPGLDRTAGTAETVLITAYGGNAMCRIGSWGGSFGVTVTCYDAAGVAADSRFDIIVVQ